jgi:hypothetical protein
MIWWAGGSVAFDGMGGLNGEKRIVHGTAALAYAAPMKTSAL